MNAIFAWMRRAFDSGGLQALKGIPVLAVRKRFTIAEVNAGANILAALGPAYKIRMVGARAIAVGGAVGATTTVDIIATQGGSAVKLVAFAQASLTQNTVLKDGGTGAAVLAAGASYIDNDANTAITIGKTGATATTATHVDVVFEYQVTPPTF